MTGTDLDFYKDTYVVVELIKKYTESREKRIKTRGILRKIEYNYSMYERKTVYCCGEYYFTPEQVVNIYNEE